MEYAVSPHRFVVTVDNGSLTAYSWSGEHTIRFPGPVIWCTVRVDRKDREKNTLLAMKHDGRSRVFCSVDVGGLLGSTSADPMLFVHPFFDFPRMFEPLSIAQVPGSTVMIGRYMDGGHDLLLYYFDDNDRTSAPETLTILSPFLRQEHNAIGVSIVAHGDILYIATNAVLFVVRDRLVHFAMPRKFANPEEVLLFSPVALSYDGQCMAMAVDRNCIVIFDVVSIGATDNILPWKSRNKPLTRWREGDSVDEWHSERFFARGSFALRRRSEFRMSVDDMGFVGENSSGLLVRGGNTLLMTEPAPAGQQSRLALWWHHTLTDDSHFSHLPIAVAGGFVLFGSRGRPPFPPSQHVLLRIRISDLVGFRARAVDICVALRGLDLPASQMMMILQEACNGAQFVPLFVVWNLVTTVKHYSCPSREPELEAAS